MRNKKISPVSFGTDRVSKIIFSLAPPVMLAQLILALYNIADSVFIGRYSDSGLTALSVIFPLQLLMMALAIGSGVGINTAVSSRLGLGREDDARDFSGIALPLSLVLYALFAAVSYFALPIYIRAQTDSPVVYADALSYGRIVSLFSIGMFVESALSKVLQARGDMKTPMLAQVVGAAVNIVLDPILIFGLMGIPAMGVSGAAIATVIGQTCAAAVVFKRGFYKPPSIKICVHCVRTALSLGLPSMLMQSAYTIYIFGLNIILATFSDAAVTVLGLYYKWQTFFLIPLDAMHTCIVPVISYNYAARNFDRCKKIVWTAILFACSFILVGTALFVFVPGILIGAFSSDALVLSIGRVAFPIIGASFVPLAVSLTFPVFFQAVGKSTHSIALTVLRTVVLFVPLAYLFSRAGLDFFWLTYPVTDGITGAVGIILFFVFARDPYKRQNSKIS